MLSISELRKQVLEARKASTPSVRALKRDDLVRELERYKPSSAPAPTPASAPKKEEAVERVAGRRTAPRKDETQAEKHERVVKPEDLRKALAPPPPPPKKESLRPAKGTPEAKAYMANLRAKKNKKADE
jgi:hypothetical protein